MLLNDLLKERRLDKSLKRQLLEQHRVRHAWHSAISEGRLLRNSDQSAITAAQVEREHDEVVNKMFKEKISHYFVDKLDETLSKDMQQRSMKKDFFKLPREIMLVKGFIETSDKKAQVHASILNGGLIAQLSINVSQLSKVLLLDTDVVTTTKKEQHTVSLYDLMLKKCEIVKPLASDDLIMLDLGCGSKKVDGCVGLDKEYSDGVNLVCDLESGIPYPNESVKEVYANNILEYVTNPDFIMREIHRVLVKDGKLHFKVAVSSSGSLVNPNCKSVWSENMLSSWIVPEMLGDRPGFGLVESLKKEVVDGGRELNIYGTVIAVKGEALRDRISSFKPFTGSFASPLKKDDKKEKHDVVFFKKDISRKLVYGVVAEPLVPDAVGEWSTAEDIGKAAHDYMEKYFNSTTISHTVGLRKEDAPIIESYLAPVDFLGDDGSIVHKGSWIMAHKVLNNEVWKDIEERKIVGYSMGGTKGVFS